MDEQTGNVKAGEAGQSGRDRQPSSGSGGGTTPGSDQSAATPGEVKRRSQEADAGMKNKSHDKSDMVHPGPNREEGERSKGDAHHDQHEKEKEMKTEGL
jgi:hypothetical protein